jgi:thymidylate synthase (FAD)
MAGEGLTRYPLGDGIGKVVLLDCMGDDLSIVNDAKQSYDRHAQEFGEKEQRLLSFLLTNNHTSPLRGAVLRFHVKAPLFVARQWWKHTVACTYVDDQLGWNEKSFRYCEAKDNEYYYPSSYRAQSSTNKQASSGLINEQDKASALYSRAVGIAVESYVDLIAMGVAKEQARAILPGCLYTSFTWTCSLQALLHFIALRKEAGAQDEIQRYAKALTSLGADKFPATFAAIALPF